MSLATSTRGVEATPTTPRTLFGYDVLDLIGHGAGSTIYCVSHPATKQLYALKHVVRKREKDGRFIEQLQAEFEVGSKVSNPHLRRSVDFQVTHTGLLRRTPVEAMLVLELFDGTSLEQHTPRDLAQIVNAFAQTAQGLHALHQLGYVHCDLKPNNILRDPVTGAVKVIDLGQAAKAGTAKQRVQGTPDFMAPEQVKLQPVTVRTDVYNFGATLYFCLAGKRLPTLFTIKRGDNSFLVDQQLPSPKDLNPLIPEQLSNLVVECVRTNPAKRPGDMSDLARKLEVIEFVIEQERKSRSPATPDEVPSDVDKDK
jgi:serine/threonine-protein kinase